MSEEFNKELKQLKREFYQIRESYLVSPSQNKLERMIQLEAQMQMVIKLMKKYYYIK